jgi:hypothetical protein
VAPGAGGAEPGRVLPGVVAVAEVDDAGNGQNWK